jgi:hypothetical protein
MSTPTKRRSWLLAWLLKNGVRGATDAELEHAAEACERLTVVSGVVVGVGLVVEVVLAFVHPSYDSALETISSVIADVLVALGVGGEVFFSARGFKCQGEMQRRSNTKLSDAIRAAGEANQKAEEARLARVKLEAQLLPRSLTKDQYEALLTLKGLDASIVVTSALDVESSRFAAQIAATLMDAGIDVKVFPPRVGIVWSGIYIVLPKPVADYTRQPLVLAFQKAEISVGCGDRSQHPMNDVPLNDTVILVGEKKGLSPSWPAYPFTMQRPNRGSQNSR